MSTEQIPTRRRRRAAVAAARKAAHAAGYYIREGSYRGTTDDRLGRWYIGHESDRFFRPFGPGHATQSAAWLTIADDLAREG
ncbi:MAG TPA: hypothetical protein VIM11_25695 [Tepidisphaeraceae bacterium]|jgi:hypothetical protein